MMSPAKPPLATGDEPFWISLSELVTDVDGGQVMDGNVLKAVLVTPQGERYFTKRYHERTAPRDAVYEFLGQRVAARAGLPAAITFLAHESPLYLLSRDFLAEGERLLTLRALRFESRFPARIVEFFEEHLKAQNHIVDVFLLDAVLNNRGRHTGNVAVVTDALGNFLRPAPLFDTVAFDGTRLWEAAKNDRARWLSPGANPDMSHSELMAVLRNHVTLPRRREVVERVVKAAHRTLEEVFSLGLVTPREREFMLQVMEQSASLLSC